MAWCSLLCNITTREVLSKDDRHRKKRQTTLYSAEQQGHPGTWVCPSYDSRFSESWCLRGRGGEDLGRLLTCKAPRHTQTQIPPHRLLREPLQTWADCFVGLWCLVTQSYLTLCDPMDYSPPGSYVHGILQARILLWVPISFSRGSSQPRDQTQAFCIVGSFFTI